MIFFISNSCNIFWHVWHAFHFFARVQRPSAHFPYIICAKCLQNIGMFVGPLHLTFLHHQNENHPSHHFVGMSFHTKVFNFSLVCLPSCLGIVGLCWTDRLVSHIAPHKSRPASVSVTLFRPWVMPHKSPNPNSAAETQLARQYLFYFAFFARDVTTVKCESGRGRFWECIGESANLSLF